MDLVMLLNFGVDMFLLIAADRLSGYCSRLPRILAASAVGAVYAGICLLPGFQFLQNIFWRIISLCCLSTIAFGCQRSTIRRGILFAFLSMALGGAVMCMESKTIVSISLCAGIVLILCIFGFGGKRSGREYVSVELYYKGKRKVITALVDTGNTLTDPVTSQSVTVLGSSVAGELLGLTDKQLCDPISTMANVAVPGLRLIPYNAVGVSRGLLLAIAVDAVKINGREVGNIVAFAPSAFQNKEGYQGLVGGMYYV